MTRAWAIGACRAQLEVVEVSIAALVADLRYAAGLFSVKAARVLHPAEAAKHAARRWHVLPRSGHHAVPVRCRRARGWAGLDLARLSAGRLGA